MYLIKTSRESDGWNPFSLRVCSNFTFCLDLVYVEVFGCLMGEGSFMLFVNLLGLYIRPGFSGHLMPHATSPSPRGWGVENRRFCCHSKRIHFYSLVCHVIVFGRRERWVIARFQLGRAAAGEALQAAASSHVNPCCFTVYASEQGVAPKVTR